MSVAVLTGDQFRRPEVSEPTISSPVRQKNRTRGGDPPSPAAQMTFSDEELVARSAGGDIESFNQLVVRWERPIYALAYRVIGREEEARDLVQEAFLRAYRSLGGFRGDAKFSSWLYRITLNLCRRARAGGVGRGSRGAARSRRRGEPGNGRPERRSAKGHRPQGIPGVDLPGDRGSAGLPPEHGEDAALSGAGRAPARAGAAGHHGRRVAPACTAGVWIGSRSTLTVRR
jgi:hypothetical protein